MVHPFTKSKATSTILDLCWSRSRRMLIHTFRTLRHLVNVFSMISRPTMLTTKVSLRSTNALLKITITIFSVHWIRLLKCQLKLRKMQRNQLKDRLNVTNNTLNSRLNNATTMKQSPPSMKLTHSLNIYKEEPHSSKLKEDSIKYSEDFRTNLVVHLYCSSLSYPWWPN